MKPTHISIAMPLVCLSLAPVVLAQQRATREADPEVHDRAAQAPVERLPQLVVPRLVRFSGIAKDSLDKPRTGIVGLTFAIYKDQEGGAALWLETQNAELNEEGRYTVLLGATKSEGVPLELFTSGEPRWLGVRVQLPGEVEQPRVLLVSVPYALKAADAETLGGKPASAFVTTETLAGNSAGAATTPASSTALTAAPSSQTQTAPKKTAAGPQVVTPCSSVTSDGTAAVNSIALFTTACNVQGSVITQVSGNVGFGTATPAVAVDVVGNNSGLRLSGTGTHQVTVTGASSGRLGEDATGFFFSSDTNGKVIKFLTNNGTLNEWMRITSAGNVGIGTTAPAQKLSVAGMIQSTAGGFVFPDTTVQTTAVPAASSVRAITYLAGCDSCSLLTNADSQNTIFVNLIGAMTIKSVTCFSDAGAPAVNIQMNHGGTLSNVLSSNLNCSTTGASSSSFSTSALSLNDSLNFLLVADGVAKRVTMIMKATVN